MNENGFVFSRKHDIWNEPFCLWLKIFCWHCEQHKQWWSINVRKHTEREADPTIECSFLKFSLFHPFRLQYFSIRPESGMDQPSMVKQRRACVCVRAYMGKVLRFLVLFGSHVCWLIASCASYCWRSEPSTTTTKCESEHTTIAIWINKYEKDNAGVIVKQLFQMLMRMKLNARREQQ